MNKKRLLVLAVASLLMLSGCSGNEEGEKTSSEGESISSKEVVPSSSAAASSEVMSSITVSGSSSSEVVSSNEVSSSLDSSTSQSIESSSSSDDFSFDSSSELSSSFESSSEGEYSSSSNEEISSEESADSSSEALSSYDETSSESTDRSSESDYSSSEEASSEESSSSSDFSSSEESSSQSSESSSAEIKTYEIVSILDEGATLEGLPNEMAAGEEISFVLKIDDGFKFESLSIKSGLNSITPTIDGNTYSFTMPKRGVTITVATSRLSYKLGISDTGHFISSITQKKVGSDSFVALGTVSEESEPDEDDNTSTSSYNTAEYGAEILVTLNEVSSYSIKGVTINDEAIEVADGDESFSFKMPAKDSLLEISYDLKPRPVSIVNSEHISLALTDSEGNEIKGEAYPGSEIRISANISDSDYGVKTIKYSYLDSSNNTKTTDITLQKDNDGNWYFTYPYGANEGVTITVTEYDLNAYKDCAFIGEYQTVDLSNLGTTSLKDFTAFNGKPLTIGASGDITYKEYVGYAIGSIDDASGKISLTKNGSYDSASIYCGKYIAFFSTYLDSNFGYLSVGVRNGASYSIKGSQFAIDGTYYALVSVYDGETNLENALIERGDDPVIHFGVDVEMLEGDYVSDAKAIFRVKDSDSALLNVGYIDEGGAKNRVVLGAEYGTYKNGDASLYLNGNGLATYEGGSYNYSLSDDGSQATLTSNDKTVVVSIDKDAMTYSVVSDQEASTPAWYGKTYKGKSQWSAYDDEETGTWTVIFSSTEVKFDLNCAYGGGNSATAGIEYEVSNGTVISAKFYDAANKNGFSVTMTYDAVKDCFTVKGGGSGSYFKNAVFSLVS